uniref:Uncharacterized protein n=1 Tax=Cacopsylla melanoneura TaxID=428564 RepID=A0A8D8QF73_9HEMI
MISSESNLRRKQLFTLKFTRFFFFKLIRAFVIYLRGCFYFSAPDSLLFFVLFFPQVTISFIYQLTINYYTKLVYKSDHDVSFFFFPISFFLPPLNFPGPYFTVKGLFLRMSL